VINTHLHADKNSTASSIRLEQLKEINSYIIKHKLNEKYPIYLAGDLNIHSSEYLHYCEDRHLYEYLKNEMKLIDPMENICEDFFTYGTSINKYSDKNSKNYKLDYILYSQSKITKPLINNDVIFKNEEALSDHCGIRCQIKK
jgi:endonuclease/exonuclease/phosphatase family metal-dependent hydrolase